MRTHRRTLLHITFATIMLAALVVLGASVALSEPPAQDDADATATAEILWATADAMSTMWAAQDQTKTVEAATQQAAATATAQARVDDVRVQFAWTHSFEYAGFYEAVERGYYTDQAINIDLMEGGFDQEERFLDPIQRVADGEADFGITSADQLLVARADGRPLIAIAAIYQRSPVVLISLTESGILRPQDLVGKRVFVMDNDILYAALMASQDIDRSQIEEISQFDFTGTALINGDTDVISGWITEEVVALRAQGYDLNLIFLGDYGINVYFQVIFTTEEMINNRPDLVERFLRATLPGYEAAINDPDHAVDLVLQYEPSLDMDYQRAAMQTAIPLIKSGSSPVGMMDEYTWAFTQELMLDQGILVEPLDPDPYTLEFLEKIYP
jgi:NitT/TauT family transport system substrate-binding protein